MPTKETHDASRGDLSGLREIRTAKDRQTTELGHCIERVHERPELTNMSNAQLEEEWFFCEDMLDICNRMNLGSGIAAGEYRERMEHIDRLRGAR